MARARTPPRPGPVRGVVQLLAVVAGGAVIGGLLVLSALPEATEPVPSLGLVALAGVVAVVTAIVGRRLGRPAARPQGRGRR